MRALLVSSLFGAAALVACTDPPGPAPLWSADPSGDNPLPDERNQDAQGLVTSPDALRRFLPKGVDTVATDTLLTGWSEHLHGVAGWGTFAPVLVRFADLSTPTAGDAGDNVDALAQPLNEAALAFVRLDKDAAPIAARATWHADPGVLEVQPLAPLPASTRVALVVQRTLIPGLRLERAPDFDARAAGDAKADVERAATALAVGSDEIALVAPYRTADSTRDLLRARALVKDIVPAYTFEDTGDDRHGVFPPALAPASLVDDPDRLPAKLAGAGTVGVGTFTSLDLRNPTTHLFTEATLSGATPPTDDPIEVIVVEPDAAVFPPPWPAVILQHGFGGSDAFVVDNAAPFIARGLAVLGIDAVSHGHRGAVTSFFNVNDVRTVRDNLRQTTVDHLLLSALATRGHVDIDGTPGDDLDGSLAYYGHSMGAILGASFALVTEDADVVAVNAAGGGLCDVFRSVDLKASLQLIFRPALGVTLDNPSYDDAYPLLTSIAQPLFEGADPIAYARTTARPRLLIQEDLGDKLVPNQSTDDLSRALELEEHGQSDSAANVDALVRLDPASYGFTADQNPHGLFDVAPIQAQAAQFILTRGAELVPAPPSP